MKAETFVDILGSEFYTGVPDSKLRPLCDYLMDSYGTDPGHHVIAANEGNCTAIAAGYHLATGKVPVVYMQNSGEGNIINPFSSLMHEEVYGIPCVFVIGWRGEPDTKDEPQHIFQGKITLKLLEDMGIRYFVVSKDTGDEEVCKVMDGFKNDLSEGRCVAFVIRKGALAYDEKVAYQNNYALTREKAIRCVAEAAGRDPVISTTGKASRELFEIREAKGEGHSYDFLTVGSMGHASSIALGVALNKPERKVWCIDGDGAVLMHMGALAVIGSLSPKNLVHVAINNGAHESVGGMPTCASKLKLSEIAKACGYPYVASAEDIETLEHELKEAKKRDSLSFIEIKCSIGSRSDLGRPTRSPMENKKGFMEHLSTLK
ncbi:MAG: phosphonopyruvate decarboxylase [Lachnospiraceae bacterium]|nr:phosphonopyruvate decarboxylase [Lachnospiraceae bacterium]